MNLCWAWLPFIGITVLSLVLSWQLAMHYDGPNGRPFSGLGWSWNWLQRKNFDAEGQRLFTWVWVVEGAWFLSFFFASWRCP